MDEPDRPFDPNDLVGDSGEPAQDMGTVKRGVTVDAGPKEADPARPRVARIGFTAKQKLDTRSTLEVAAVLTTIQRERKPLLDIKDCYTEYVKQHPTAVEGALSLYFVVNEAGEATEVDARGIGPELEACVEKIMMRWRFAEPRTAAGDPTEARFRLDAKLSFE